MGRVADDPASYDAYRACLLDTFGTESRAPRPVAHGGRRAQDVSRHAPEL